jgi:outer membrane receptor protein involved in Fe transport
MQHDKKEVEGVAMLGSRTFRLTLFSGSAMVALACAIPGAVAAQTAPVDPPVQNPPAASATQPSSDEGQTITVTGTRVMRDGFQAPTPVTVMTKEDLENTSPTNNLADVVNQLPALAGSIRPSNSRLELSNGIAGINALNLRNLGTFRTLVLIDGRRSVGSTVTGVVDVSTIPQSLVERVDVVTGGASAAYGSDAVAGVTNFILKKNYKGLSISADIGATDKGDGFNYSVEVAGGLEFADGRGHVMAAASLDHTDGIFDTNDRDWNQTGFVRIQNPAWTAGSTTEPQYLIRHRVGAANSTPGGLITNSSGGSPLCGTYFGAGGSVNQFQPGALSQPATFCPSPSRTQGGDWRLNDSGRRIGIDPRDDRYGIFGRVSFDVTDDVTLFAQGSFNRSETLFNAGPNLMTGLTLQASNCAVVPTPTTCNAFLYNTFAASPSGAGILAGRNTVTLATTAVDLPNRNSNNVRKVQRYLIGAEGKLDLFGKSANWDIYGQYGVAKLHEQLRNIQQTQRRNAALAAVFAPAGNPGGYPVGSIQCLINVDANLTNDDPACRPLNLLGIGVADPAAIDYILGDPYRDQKLEQTVFGANLSFTPFATWAGDVSVAVGAEYRKEKISGSVPEEFQPIISGGNTTTRWSVGNFLPTKGSYNVKEAYLETVVPLGLGLEFNGAVRATDYSVSGYVTTWKAGATWQPIDDIRFRVTRSRDIRAPNLNDLFNAGSQNTSTVTNPFTTGPFAVFGNPMSYLGTVKGNLDLKPEKADQWNAGVVVSPRFIPGFTASADYFHIKMKDAIDSLSAQDIVNRCFEGLSQFCDAIVPDPSNPTGRVLISRSPFNFSSLKVSGVDLDAAYRLRLGDGNFTLRGVATRYIHRIEDTGIATAVPIDIVGTDSLPKWFFRFTASYDTPSYSVTAVARGVSASTYQETFTERPIECQNSCPVSTTQFPTYDDTDISGAFYVDLNLTKKIDVWGKGNGEIFLNVTNVFDRWPILLPETGLAANSTYSNLLGRAFRVGLRLQTK